MKAKKYRIIYRSPFTPEGWWTEGKKGLDFDSAWDERDYLEGMGYTVRIEDN